MNRNRNLAAMLLLALLALAGCSDRDGGERAAARFALLEQVPADTPYVVAASRPLPRALSGHMLRAVSYKMQARGEQLRRQRDGVDDPGLRRVLHLTEALVGELEGRLSPEGLKSLGFPVAGRSLIYGLGILPVAWLEIEDPAKVQAFLDRVEQRAGEPSRRLVLKGVEYRRWTFGEIDGVAAVREGYLVMSLLPADGDEQLLSLALGVEKPETSLAEAGTFKAFVAERGYQGYGDGYIDLLGLVKMALGETGGVNARVLQALGFRPEVISPGCRDLALHLAGSLPRIAFGYLEARDHAYVAEAALETAPAAGGWLARLAAPVPGLGGASDATFALGLGLDLPTVRDALKAALADVAEQGSRCELVDREELTRSMQSLDLLLNPMVAGIRGFNLVVDRIRLDPGSLDIRSVRARLLVAATDPRGLFGMAAVLDPRLAALQIPADGTPVVLPLADTVPDAPPAWVAVRDQALGLYVGDIQPKESVAFLQAPPAEKGLILSLDYDVKKLLEQIGPSLEAAMGWIQGPERDEVREIYQTIRETAELYRSFHFAVYGFQRGLVMRGRVEFEPGEQGREP